MHIPPERRAFRDLKFFEFNPHQFVLFHYVSYPAKSYHLRRSLARMMQ